MITLRKFSHRTAAFTLQQPQFHFWLITLFAALLLFVNLQRGDLAGYDDAVYAHEAKHMLQTGDWWNVWLDGRLDFDKPPLFIWLEALSLWVFGVSDFAAKFPAALLGLGTIILVYFITHELTADRWLACAAMLVLTSTQYFLKYASHAMTDVPFTFFFTLSLWAYLKGLRKPPYLLLCGLSLGLGMLIRSIIGLSGLGIIGLHLLLSRNLKLLRQPALWMGLTLALVLPGMWFVQQYHWYGAEFLARHFAYTQENLQPIVTIEQRWWYGVWHYPWLLLKLYWPWWPALLGGLVLAARRAYRTQEVAATFLLLCVLGVVLPFSLLQHKVLRYILPAFPAFSILAAMALLQWVLPTRRLVTFKVAYALLGVAILIMTLHPGHLLRARDIVKLAPLIEAHTRPEQRTLFYMGGANRWDYVHQFIWYANRYGDLVRDEGAICTVLNTPTETPVIMDHETFRQLFRGHYADLEVLGESENLVALWRAAPKGSAGRLVQQPLDSSLQIR